MTGGILQLSQYGAEDILLTGNPQVSFFKTIYKRYTNFQIQSLQQTIEGNIDFGNTIYTTINKSGHLLNNIILQLHCQHLILQIVIILIIVILII